MATRKGAKAKTLDDLGVEWLCDKLTAGETQTEICDELKIGIATLGRWIAADTERSARVREARIAAARSYDEKAEQELKGAKDPFELAKAKELAHHYRWKASKSDPGSYGDKVAVGGAADLPPIETKSTLNVAGLNDDQLRALASIAVHRS